MQKGQANILAIIGIGASIFIASIGGYIAQNVRTDDKIGKTTVEINATKERVATLEEAIKTLKTDNAEIKMDLKEILKRMK